MYLGDAPQVSVVMPVSNTAIDLARGRSAVRLDQDDLAIPTQLQRTVEALTADPNAGLSISNYVRWFPGVDDG